MRAALFLVLSFFVFFSVNKAYAFSCDPDLKRHYNILDIVLQNDFIFIGTWIGHENNNGEVISEYKVIEPLKGSLEGITSLKVKVKGKTLNPNMLPFSMYRANFADDRSLIYIRYGDNSELTMTGYSCQDVPDTRTIISFLKGPYRYRYFILFLVAFAVFSIWRVGGPVNLLTADLKSLFGTIFLNKPIQISNNPSLFRKILMRISIPILMLGPFLLFVLINRYLLLYNFY